MGKLTSHFNTDLNCRSHPYDGFMGVMMKNELRLIGGFKSNVKQGRAIDQLYHEFLNDRNFDNDTIDEMWESLTPEQQAISFETITMFRMRAYAASGKPIQAYETIAHALTRLPNNLSLLLELKPCVQNCFAQLDSLFNDDPLSPLIPILYRICLSEGFINPATQTRYLEYLVRTGNSKEALPLALILGELFPAALGLKAAIEVLLQLTPHPVLEQFLRDHAVAEKINVISSEVSPKQMSRYVKGFYKIQEMIQSAPGEPMIDEALNEIIGDSDPELPINLAVKDFYYLRASLFSARERHFEAVLLLKRLADIDPCNFYFKRALQQAVDNLSVDLIAAFEKKDLALDLSGLFEHLKDFSLLSYKLIKTVALYEVGKGEIVPARQKMTALCNINPYDGDYLLAALEVALAAKDSEWITQIMARIDELKEQRPWDVTLNALEVAQ